MTGLRHFQPEKLKAVQTGELLLMELELGGVSPEASLGRFLSCVYGVQ